MDTSRHTNACYSMKTHRKLSEIVSSGSSAYCKLNRIDSSTAYLLRSACGCSQTVCERCVCVCVGRACVWIENKTQSVSLSACGVRESMCITHMFHTIIRPLVVCADVTNAADTCSLVFRIPFASRMAYVCVCVCAERCCAAVAALLSPMPSGVCVSECFECECQYVCVCVHVSCCCCCRRLFYYCGFVGPFFRNSMSFAVFGTVRRHSARFHLYTSRRNIIHRLYACISARATSAKRQKHWDTARNQLSYWVWTHKKAVSSICRYYRQAQASGLCIFLPFPRSEQCWVHRMCCILISICVAHEN